MRRLVIGLIALGAVLASYGIGNKVMNKLKSSALTSEAQNENVQEAKYVDRSHLMDKANAASNAVKITTLKKTLILEAKNSVTLRGPITGQSVGALMRSINKMSKSLPKSEPIYLILDTPGGSVFDGMDLIDFLEGIPQEIRTVTLFAASMGFQVAENNPGKRIIARNGVLMSHRAKGGLEGQFDGELESRYKMVKQKIDYLDSTVAARVSMSVDDYKQKITNEWWVHGFNAVDEKVADEMNLILCGSSIKGEETTMIDTFFGPVKVTFDKCPLVREPISVDLAQVRADAKEYVQGVIDQLFNDKIKFTKDVILTNKFYSIFR